MAAPEIGLGCGTLMQAELAELIEVAARHGFPTITVRPASFARARGEGMTEAMLRRRLRDAGVAVRMVDALTQCLPGASTLDASDPKQRHLPREVFFPPDEETCFAAAEVLGSPFVNITHFGQQPAPIEAMIESLDAICDRASARGLRIAVEFIPGTGIPDLPTADRLARACGAGRCGITLDPWHLDRSGGTLADVLGLAPAAFAGMQLCDRIAEPPGAPYVPMSGRRMPGEGELPLAELVEAALANSPGITIEAEIINEDITSRGADEAAAYVAAGIEAWRRSYPETAATPTLRDSAEPRRIP